MPFYPSNCRQVSLLFSTTRNHWSSRNRHGPFLFMRAALLLVCLARSCQGFQSIAHRLSPSVYTLLMISWTCHDPELCILKNYVMLVWVFNLQVHKDRGCFLAPRLLLFRARTRTRALSLCACRCVHECCLSTVWHFMKACTPSNTIADLIKYACIRNWIQNLLLHRCIFNWSYLCTFVDHTCKYLSRARSSPLALSL